MKGGSKASNLVMETSNPKLCDDPTSVVTEGSPIAGDVRQLSLYQTTGGGRRRRSKSKSRKSKSKKSKSKKSKSKRQQKNNLKGGSRSKNRFPLRKRKKRYAKRCSACESCGRQMVGGSPSSNLVMATNPHMCRDASNPVTAGNPHSENIGKTQLYATTGGARIKYGENHPGVNIQGNCEQNGGGEHEYVEAHPNVNHKAQCGQHGGGSDWRGTVYSRGPVNQPSQDPAHFRMFTQSGDFYTNEALRAAKFTGGSRSAKKSKKRKSKSKKINSIRSDRTNSSRSRQRGGGSDWVGTLYSRGPVNQPSAGPQHFRAFTAQGQYIPNESLRTAKFM